MGEKKVHIYSCRGKTVNSESLLRPDYQQYWVSPSSKTNIKGLQVMLKTEGATTPERVVFANWKRFNESSRAYDVNPSRNFNYLPYSINDSAVGMFYEVSNLSRDETREIGIVAGGFSGSSFAYSDYISTGSDDLSNIFNQTISREVDLARDRTAALKTELFAVNDFLSQIDRKIEYTESVTKENLP